MKVLLYKPIQNDYINNSLEVCRRLNWIEIIVMIMKSIHSNVMVYNINSPLTFLEAYCPFKKDNVMVLVCVGDNMNHNEKQGLAQNIRKRRKLTKA